MTYKEPNYETVIVQKLRAMEDLLKSFMDSLERPFQRKGSEISVYAEITGIIRWRKSALQPVAYGDELCRIYSTERPGVSDYVSARGGGILFIEPGADEGAVVSMGDLIATIVQEESDFYPQ